MIPEAISSKHKVDNTEMLDGTECMCGLARLGQPLRGATETPKISRPFAQWVLCFWRPVPFPFEDFVSDELHRKQPEKRCYRGDHGLDKDDFFLQLYKPTMELSRQRLQSRLRAAAIPVTGAGGTEMPSLKLQAESAAAALKK